MAKGIKRAIRYMDLSGVEHTKNCGNAEEERRCVTWIKRRGYELLGKKS
jgi:hypothetical protein